MDENVTLKKINQGEKTNIQTQMAGFIPYTVAEDSLKINLHYPRSSILLTKSDIEKAMGCRLVFKKVK